MSATRMRDAAAIAATNDAFRRRLGLGMRGGRSVMTRGIAALPGDELAAVLKAVARFDAFTAGNDPWKERDCARLEAAGHTVIWKIDYYEDDAMRFGAEDPQRAYRVLTIMLAEEY